MQTTHDLLIEIGTEELPPTSLLSLSDAFCEHLSAGMKDAGLDFSRIEPFATPRRIACLARDLAEQQPDQLLMRRGPAVAAAFDSAGQPTKAALGFARACDLAVSDLLQEDTDKGPCLVARRTIPGKPTAELVPAMVEHALAMLPIPKRMRWADHDEEFVRPVHWICLILGSRPLPARILGIEASGETRGHRFHHPEPIAIRTAGEYASRLREEGFVEPLFARRRAMIADQVTDLAASISGRAGLTPELLDEVTALCEWPCAVLGSFDEAFLEIPAEVLVETMQKNQKYFPVHDETGRLLPRFITIANIESRDPAIVRAGNERVLRPRFADAAFFWRQDLKRPLESYFVALEQVIFQKRLGTLADKSRRVARLALFIAERVGADADQVARAAKLSKCDLVTQMIFEFPALQGIMGRYYAERSGEHEAVAEAIAEQYLPRHAGDRLPKSLAGVVLSLAERTDTLVGIFAIGQRPTGIKDPYALRRAAIGTLRLMIEAPINLSLREILEHAAAGLSDRVDARTAAEDVFDYIVERLRHYYVEQGVRSDSVEAVTALSLPSPADMDRRIRAVEIFRQLPEAASLIAANKRIRNILRQAPATDEEVRLPPDADLFEEPAERLLADQLASLDSALQARIGEDDYLAALEALARLHDPVNDFFDQVLVMAPDPRVRLNRLRLLAQVQESFLGVADISRLQQ